MPDVYSLQEQAQTCSAKAEDHDQAGHEAERLAALSQAVLLYAAAEKPDDGEDEAAGPLTRPRADVCSLYADALASAGRHAEAVNVYQEATDLYGRIGDPDAQSRAQECARRLLDCLTALRTQPGERLHLLTARYERAREQLALEPGTELKQAECCVHIARIYQRRERPVDSLAWYQQALNLLDRCDGSPEIELLRAECHHRMGTLTGEHLSMPADAVAHYHQAIALYKEYEPFTYGFQQSLELCSAALTRTEAAVARQDQGRDREWSRE
jgi:tetratricopeptide (TPR) repeat protein